MKFNEKLIELRKKEGLSQEELGYKLNVTRQTVSKWELGQTTPEMEKLVEMSKIFNVSVDELVNEKEVTSTEKTVIEDQEIEEGGSKENKVKFIIIAILLVVLVCIVIKMVMGFSSLNKTTEKQGFFDKFFSTVDKLSSQQQNIIGDSEGNVQGMMGNAEEIFNNVQGIMGNAFGQVNITRFNATLELYKGSQKGASVKRLFDEVITSNKKDERKITVNFIETETQDVEVIKNLKSNIVDFDNYEISFEYDAEGYIYKAVIEKIS